ncbi:glycosyl hydrolase [bacterium]|nr:MAG: glycosyl hydrolase [bacterium]
MILILLFLYPPGSRLVVSQQKEKNTSAKVYDVSLFKSMQWRNIGPFRGGRSIAVAGHADQPYTFYFGATGGGIWKTDDGGITWSNVSDGFLKSSSVGAIEVAASDPNVIYVGTGESCIRGNISPGDGIYKSQDAGKTWSHVGLKETQFIGKIAVHPKNPDVVYVAAMGQVFGQNKERGIYRSLDGGITWKNVLFKDDKTGAVDMQIDPNNPRVLYAALWEAYRNPWSMSSGGPGSGLYKSTDGGDTWTELTKNPGMPKGIVGKIGIAVSPAQVDRVWAVVESERGGVFRSDDGGATWMRTNEERNLRQRAWYYSHIYADPKNSETVYVLNVQFFKSMDGGKTFKSMPSQHGDHHDLWINPHDQNNLIIADDGGAVVSYNGGKSWTDQDIATAQFYHVTVDNQFPYHVYGAQQDNSTIDIVSRTNSWGIDFTDWHPVAGGESGYIAVHPEKPHITFGGSYGGYLTKYNHLTKQEQNISVWPDSPIGSGTLGSKYRFQWTYPVIISQHDQNTLYVTAQNVLRSTDEGVSWNVISPDLTRNDTNKQKASGGPITKDNTSVEFYNTIFTLAESPKEKGLFWTGSDDGLVHIRRDEKFDWKNITPKDLPEWALVSMIEASPFDAGTAYLAATRYKLNDFQPYLFKTNDFGKTWKKITNGIPSGAYTRVIREDPNRNGLLYAGTETGIYISFNAGESWQSLQLNLPVTPIHDIAVQARDMDLVVATHGRSFWILDDLSPLHQLSDAIAKSDKHLYKPRFAYRKEGFQYLRPGLALGQNPPNGVLVNYYFQEKPKDEITLDFMDETGKTIITYSSIKDKRGKAIKPSEEFYEKPKETRMGVVPSDTGMNRFVWDMRYPDAEEVPGAIFWDGSIAGPKMLPGTYRVRLTCGAFTQTESFEIKKDPRVDASEEDLVLQLDLLLKINSKLTETHKTINSIREIQKQINEFSGKIKDTIIVRQIKEFAKPLLDSLTFVENELIQTKIKSNQDVLNYPMKLNNKLASLASAVASADSKPTNQSYDVFDFLSTQIDKQLSIWMRLREIELPKFNSYIKSLDIQAVILEIK